MSTQKFKYDRRLGLKVTKWRRGDGRWEVTTRIKRHLARLDGFGPMTDADAEAVRRAIFLMEQARLRREAG